MCESEKQIPETQVSQVFVSRAILQETSNSKSQISFTNSTQGKYLHAVKKKPVQLQSSLMSPGRHDSDCRSENSAEERGFSASSSKSPISRRSKSRSKSRGYSPTPPQIQSVSLQPSQALGVKRTYPFETSLQTAPNITKK